MLLFSDTKHVVENNGHVPETIVFADLGTVWQRRPSKDS